MRREGRDHCHVEPETEEVIHCLAELVTAGSPEATKLFSAWSAGSLLVPVNESRAVVIVTTALFVSRFARGSVPGATETADAICRHRNIARFDREHLVPR